MKPFDSSTPVLLLGCQLGALGAMRSLGRLGIRVYGLDSDQKAPALKSRYCAGRFIMSIDVEQPNELIENLLEISAEIGKKSILIATTDETAVFVAQYSEKLGEKFIYPKNDVAIVKELMNKKDLFGLARRVNVPTPHTEFPESIDDVRKYIKDAKFPLVLKGILGNRLQSRTAKKMVIVETPDELIKEYTLLEDSDQPNLMLQEYIPGDDAQVWIFNGYFDSESECLNPFTGHKIRQYPVHVGCASLGICKWNKEVSDITIKFMKDINYRGILDIGYRLDPRDGKYKLLDPNPRMGQAFRIFVSPQGNDVIRDLYRDLTGQKREQVGGTEGRRWVIEDFDLISSFDYFREGTLSFGNWVSSFRRVEEFAWFDWDDPIPFLRMLYSFIGLQLKKLPSRFRARL